MIAIYAARNNAGSYVNKLGKHLNQTLDGAYKIKFSPMSCDVFIEVLFDIPGQFDSFIDEKFDINIVSYQDKLRINITEISKREKTIGQLILKDIDLADMSDFSQVISYIKTSINKFLEKEYPDYYLVY